MRNFNSSRVLVPALVALLFATTACTSSDDYKPSSQATETLKGAKLNDTEACDKEKVGGAVTFGAYIDGPGLDPAAPQANQGVTQQAAIFDTLVTFDYETASYEPDVAKSLTPNGDSTEWTLKLRDGVEFGDGSPLTAEAVKGSIERFSDPKNPSTFTSMVALIKSMDVVDDQTLNFKLTDSWGTFPYILSMEPGMVVNPKVLDEISPEELALNPPAAAGVGAYEVVSYKANDSLVLKAKEKWWGGPVCIRDLTINVTVDGKTKLDSFQTGQTQAFVTFDSPVAKQLQTSRDKFVVLGNPTISTVQVLAREGAPLADPRLRQALQYGMDLELINKRIYSNVGVPTAGLVSPDSPVAPEVKPLSFDKAKAAALVKEVKKDGAKAAFAYSVNAAPLQIDLSILQDAFWKSIGLTVKRDELQNNDLVNNVYIERNYEAAQWGMAADPACLWCGLDTWRSDNPTNIAEYANPDMDKNLIALREAGSPEEVKAAIGKVQEVWNETVPAPIAGYLKWVVGIADNLQGLRFSSGQLVSFEHAYLTK